MHIREVAPEPDFDRLPDLLNTDRAEPVTSDTLRRWHFRVSPGRIQRRILAEVDGRLVGYGVLNYEQFMPVNEFEIWVMTHPEERRKGIGSALYEDLHGVALSHGAHRLTCEVADDDPDALMWAERRGFQKTRHTFASRLYLESFDETPFTGVVEGVQAGGIRLASMAHFPDSEAVRRNLYDLNRETGLEIPNGDPLFPSFDHFRQNVFESDWYRPEGQILALDGDVWVGMCAIRYIPANNSMYNNMTGVRRAYRGRGIALALKLLAIRYARSFGALFVRTHNDFGNAPMLAINRKLGYQPEPGIYGMKMSPVRAPDSWKAAPQEVDHGLDDH